MYTLAVDIGGTKLAAAVVSPTGEITARRQRPTEAHGGPEALFAGLCEVIGETWDAAALEGVPTPSVVGVGCGGPMARGGEAVSPLNIPAWRKFPLRSRLAAATGLPTYVDNDAKALAVAEGWLGAAQGCRDYIAMVVSTGVGGGIVSDGRLLEGADGNAGHIGHVYVSEEMAAWDGHPAGLLETGASGLGIVHQCGRPPTEADASTITTTGRWVGRGIASVANLLDLRLAVVAGSVALGFGEPFFVAAQAELDRLCTLDHSRGVRVIPAGLGADGPIVGAAAVALRATGHLKIW